MRVLSRFGQRKGAVLLLAPPEIYDGASGYFLVVADFVNWAKEQGIEFTSLAELAEEAKAREAVQGIVDRVNEGLSRAEQIKKWAILSKQFTQEEEEVTPTMKVRRGTIEKKYADEIEKLYA